MSPHLQPAHSSRADLAFVFCLVFSESTETEFNYTGAAELFRNPEVTDPKAVKLEWKVRAGTAALCCCCCSLPF